MTVTRVIGTPIAAVTPPRPRRARAISEHSVIIDRMVSLIEFVDWADQRAAVGRAQPTWQQIRDRYSVHRATAYRWLSAWQQARGLRGTL